MPIIFQVEEIVYRLLTGGQGARLSHLLASGGDSRRISKAIGRLREQFDKPLKIEDIAAANSEPGTMRMRHPSPGVRAIRSNAATTARVPMARATRSPAGARRSIVMAVKRL